MNNKDFIKNSDCFELTEDNRVLIKWDKLEKQLDLKDWNELKKLRDDSIIVEKNHNNDNS